MRYDSLNLHHAGVVVLVRYDHSAEGFAYRRVRAGGAYEYACDDSLSRTKKAWALPVRSRRGFCYNQLLITAPSASYQPLRALDANFAKIREIIYCR